MMPSRVGVIYKALVAAGLPVRNVYDDATGVHVQLATNATQAQQQQANQLAAAYKSRRPKAATVLEAEVDTLSATNRRLLFDAALKAVAVMILQGRPDFAQKLGLGIVGDEEETIT